MSDFDNLPKDLDTEISEKENENFKHNYTSVEVNSLKIGDVISYLNTDATITTIKPFAAYESKKNMKMFILDNDPERFIVYSDPEKSQAWKLNAVNLKYVNFVNKVNKQDKEGMPVLHEIKDTDFRE